MINKRRNGRKGKENSTEISNNETEKSFDEAEENQHRRLRKPLSKKRG
jgi:hypothetical protein